MGLAMHVVIHHIFVSPGHNYVGRYGKEPLTHDVRDLEEARCVAGAGIEGDRYFAKVPGHKKQATFFAWEVYQQVVAELQVAGLSASAMRRNVLIEGIDLNSLIGRSFLLQGVQFVGVEECKPCFWMDRAVAEGAFDWMKGRGGLRCQILSDGALRKGSCELELVNP